MTPGVRADKKTYVADVVERHRLLNDGTAPKAAGVRPLPVHHRGRVESGGVQRGVVVRKYEVVNRVKVVGTFASGHPAEHAGISVTGDCDDSVGVEGCDVHRSARNYDRLSAVKPGVVAGCILVFVPSLGSFLAPDLLGGAKNFMIGSLIEEQFKGNAGNWPFGAAASMVLLTLVLVILIITARQQTRNEQKI